MALFNPYLNDDEDLDDPLDTLRPAGAMTGESYIDTFNRLADGALSSLEDFASEIPAPEDPPVVESPEAIAMPDIEPMANEVSPQDSPSLEAMDPLSLPEDVALTDSPLPEQSTQEKITPTVAIQPPQFSDEKRAAQERLLQELVRTSIRQEMQGLPSVQMALRGDEG